MLVVALLSWWYTAAWSDLGHRVGHRLNRTMDFFSVGLLARTLFDPYRQIAAVKGAGGSLDNQMKAWADRTFSRVFGAVIRFLFIIIGLIVGAFMALVGLVQLITWPIIPLIPLIAVAGMALQWTL